jgi:nucleotide-binding universal stress UspA family protein
MTILVPLDLNAASRPAVEYALRLAAPLEASLVLLHVTDRPCPAWLFGSIGRRMLPDAITRRARQLLNALAESARQRGVRLRCMVREGVPGYEILRLAESLDVALIVLGRSARGALNRLVFGSVIGEVVEASRCPVLVVPANE